MKITFIEVGMSGALSSDAMQPLAFAILAGLTPKKHQIAFYDDRIEKIPMKLESDVVAISTGTYTARRAYELAATYRAQGIKVILGGYHPTFMPEEALQYADSVVIGDAENTWPLVLQDLEEGKLNRVYQAENPPDINKALYDETIFENKKYSKIMPVQFSRGCKFDCEFCSINAFYGDNIRYRSIDCVIEEIQRKQAKLLFIVDDNLFVDRSKTIAFLKALTALKVKWVCQISIDVAGDDELLQLMAESGCICALIGFETLNLNNLKLMKKGANLVHKDYYKVVKHIQSYGIMVYGTFILGYDDDDESSFDRCLEFALKSQLILANFNPLTPMVGTRLYDRFKKEGRLIYEKWWLDPNYKYGSAMFYPKKMTPLELEEGCYRIRKEFNKYGNIFNRYISNPTNKQYTGIFLAANLISRREIMNKQGRLL